MAAPNLALEGFRALRVSPGEILLKLTVSNKLGQSFRWRERRYRSPAPSTDQAPLAPSDEHLTEWSFCLEDRVVLLRQDPQNHKIWHKTLVPGPALPTPEQEEGTAAWLRDYLNLDVPLGKLYETWSSRDPVFAQLAGRFRGIRMLRQDPWECLVSFICSSNNNIARIGQMVQNLCTHFSPCLLSTEHVSEDDPAIVEQVHYHPFPSPETLAGANVEQRLRELGFGYRAKYIAKTAKMLCDAHSGDSAAAATERSAKRIKREKSPHVHNDVQRWTVAEYLMSLRDMTYPDARQELIQFPGIGPKVADCILLMSMDQPESIPVDRHVFAFAEKRYKIKSKKYEDIADKLRDLWGEYAGWAHSILFTADLRAFSQYEGGAQIKAEPISVSSESAFYSQQAQVTVKIETTDDLPDTSDVGAIAAAIAPLGEPKTAAEMTADDAESKPTQSSAQNSESHATSRAIPVKTAQHALIDSHFKSAPRASRRSRAVASKR